MSFLEFKCQLYAILPRISESVKYDKNHWGATGFGG